MQFRRLASVAGFAALLATTSSAVTTYGVTDLNTLVRFNILTPESPTLVGAVTDLALGETVVGLDSRPATNELYALGSASNLYTIDKTTGAATFVATLSVPLSGTAFGFDFNPTVDRIRIVSNTGQNLRTNPLSGAVTVDGTLAYGAGDANFGATPDIQAVAYTNSYGPTAPTSTVLYNVDRSLGILTRQNPPNNGTLTTRGSLGLASPVTDADVLSRGGANRLFLISQGLTQTELHGVRVDTGAADSRGMFPVGVRVNYFALEITSAPPAP